MKALVMAAGFGSRLKGYTDQPKSTLDVDGTPLIIRTVDMLLSKGIEVAVAVGYKHKIIEDLLKDRDVKFYCNPFFRVTNNIASCWMCKDFFDDDIIITNADIYWSDKALAVLTDTDKEVTMLADKTTAKEGDLLLKLDGDRIIKFGKDLAYEDRDTESLGIAFIKKSFIPQFLKNVEEFIEAEDYGIWWDSVLYTLSEKYPVYVKDISDQFWAEVDTQEDYERILKFVRTKDVKSKYRVKKQ